MKHRISNSVGSNYSPLEEGQGVCFLLAFLLTFSACTSRNTDEDWEKNGKVRLVLDWGTRAAYSGVFDYYFYTEGNPIPLIRRGDASGYEGTVPRGNYQVVVCNPDGVNLDLQMNNGYAGAHAVAHTSVLTRASEAAIRQPANLYGTGREGVKATATASETVVLTPGNLVKEVILNIRIEGGSEISVIDGELSGIPPEVCIPTGELCTVRNALIRFSTQADGLNRYTTTLSLFGLRTESDPQTAVPATLSLAVEQKDGQSFVSHTDVTEQMNEAVINGLAARIELDVTVSPLAAGGFTIEVTGWREGTAEVEGTAVAGSE